MKKLTAIFCALALVLGTASAASPEGPEATLPTTPEAPIAVMEALSDRLGAVPVQIYDEETGDYGPMTAADGVRITLDGAELALDVPAFARAVDGEDIRTMVPVRVIAEGLGADVLWLEAERQVLIIQGEDRILLTLGSPTALVDGEEFSLPGGVPAIMVASDGGERTMVPLRFVSEQLHARVDWDNDSWTAAITTASAEPEPEEEPEQTLAGYSVALDAGHGGIYSGAYYEKTMEKDLTLAITLRVAQLLEEKGCRVVLTRSGDQTVDLYDRCDIANDAGVDIFVSIHCNASVVSSTFQGTFTYAYPGSREGAKLARTLQAATVAATGSIDRGLLTEDFVVLRETDMPAALVETGFMTCHEELMRLKDPDYQEKLAQGIAQGVENYFTAHNN